MPDMDRISLYRCLDWLIEHQFVYRIDVGGQKMYGACSCSDAESGQPTHAGTHFRCSACGLTQCLQVDLGPSIQLPEGFVNQQVDVLVTGLCSACAATE